MRLQRGRQIHHFQQQFGKHCFACHIQNVVLVNVLADKYGVTNHALKALYVFKRGFIIIGKGPFAFFFHTCINAALVVGHFGECLNEFLTNKSRCKDLKPFEQNPKEKGAGHGNRALHDRLLKFGVEETKKGQKDLAKNPCIHVILVEESRKGEKRLFPVPLKKFKKTEPKT